MHLEMVISGCPLRFGPMSELGWQQSSVCSLIAVSLCPQSLQPKLTRIQELSEMGGISCPPCRLGLWASGTFFFFQIK